jgi:predicted dehydrogenase
VKEQLSACVIGAGPWGTTLAASLERSPHFTLVWHCDSDPARLAAVPPSRRAPDLRQVLERAPEIDLFCVAVGPPVQAEVALQVLQLGSAILIEKPMAMNRAQAGEILAATARSQGLVAVNHLTRHSPAHRFAQRLLESGELGRAQGVLAVRHGGRLRPGTTLWWSMGVHDVATAELALGPLRAESFRSPSEQHFVADFRASSGAVARLSIGHGGLPERMTLYQGTERTVLVDETDESVWSVSVPARGAGAPLGESLARLKAAGRRVFSAPPGTDLLQLTWADLAGAMRGSRRPLVGAEEGARVVDLMTEAEALASSVPGGRSL